MDPSTQAALETTLNKALADRAELDAVIGYLSQQLGRPMPSGPIPPGPGGGGGQRPPQVGVDPVAGVNESEYFGQSATKAALDVLTRFGSQRHPLKTKAIFDALRKGGVKISTEEGLYTSLARSNRFRKVGRGLWGLSEWYGSAPKQPRKAEGAPGTNVTNIASGEDSDDGDNSQEAG